VSQFTKVPVGEFMLRFGIGCASDQIPVVEGAVDEIVKALQAKGPTAAELEKVTRTWLNEHDARTKTNDYWSEHLRDRALAPGPDDEGADYVTRVNALTAADVQAAARLYADPANRVRLALAPGPAAAGQ
jgi:zinc protease